MKSPQMDLFKRSALALSATLMLTACATIAPPQPPSLGLPKPPSDLRATRKGDRVTLTWTTPTMTTDRQTVRSTGSARICRGLELKLSQCGKPVGGAPPPKVTSTTSSVKTKLTMSFTDSLAGQIQRDSSPGFMTYAIEVLNLDGRGAGLSNQVRVSLARTLPPPSGFEARVTAQGVVLTWTNGAAVAGSERSIHYVDRVYRQAEGSQEQILVGEVPFGSGTTGTLTDSGIEWEKTYEYHVETVTVVAQDSKPELQVEGDDSPEIKVFAHDVFPPAVPSGLQAVASGPGQKTFIDLIWAPVTDADLDGYNVYRREEGRQEDRHEGIAAVKINAAPLKTPAYRDAAVAPGKHYLYSVSAVDVRGNESARSEEAGETAP